MDSDKVIDNTLKVINDISDIILGRKKDGSRRSIIDAKVKIEKAKKKSHKKI